MTNLPISNRGVRCEKNSAGALPSEIPVFLAQGTTDQIINPNVTRDYMNKLCNAGSKVKLLVLPDVGHGCAAQASTITAVNWISGRFTGAAVPDDCVR